MGLYVNLPFSLSTSSVSVFPPIIAQFQRGLDKNQTNVLFRLLKKYSPEDRKTRKERLVAEAKAKAESTIYVYPRETSRKIKAFPS